MDLPFGLTLYKNDPGAWGASLLNNAELMVALLDAAQARSVMEVGAYAGDFTELLLRWAEPTRARIIAVDPSPQPELEALAAEHDELELVRETSLAMLPAADPVDALVIDGDHNHYTVTAELQAIAGQPHPAHGPLIILHDCNWPHARRDDYYDPEQIPAPARHPVHHGGGLYPGVPGIRPGAMPYRWPAAQEGGPRNGVLTAVEDHVAAHPELRLAVLPTFYGVGVVWDRSAPYADALEQAVAPWEDNPLLQRLERNRVLHLASSQVQLTMARDAQAKLARIEPLLDAMLSSRAFWAAEMFLRVRQRGKPAFSRRAVRDARGA